jgi:integrase
VPTLREFSAGFWDFDTSAYLKSRKGRRPITKNYAAKGEYAVRSHILEFFGDKRLDELTSTEIDKWLTGFVGRGYKMNTGNMAFKILNTMLNWAVEHDHISSNPCKKVKLLTASDEKVISILTVDECARLFPSDWETVWDDKLFYVINRLASCTAMRHGELLGLRSEFVHGTYIDVCGQYGAYGYGDVKTHKPRNIPIPTELHDDLISLARENTQGYLFVLDGKNKPVTQTTVRNHLYKALERIGIGEDERKRRHLCMHGWRHFFNTELLSENVSVVKTQEVTGHVSDDMTMRYSHLDPRAFAEVRAVQDKLMASSKKPEQQSI